MKIFFTLFFVLLFAFSGFSRNSKRRANAYWLEVNKFSNYDSTKYIFFSLTYHDSILVYQELEYKGVALLYLNKELFNPDSIFIKVSLNSDLFEFKHPSNLTMSLRSLELNKPIIVENQISFKLIKYYTVTKRRSEINGEFTPINLNAPVVRKRDPRAAAIFCR